MDVLKFCPKCEQVKGSQDFYPDSSRKGGLSSYCSACSKLRCADRYRNNKEEHNAKTRAYYTSHKTEAALMQVKYAASHKEKIRKYQKEYVACNRPAIRVHKEKWRKNNLDKLNAKEKRRQAQRLRATPSWADKAKIAAFYKLAQVLSGTDVAYQVDHIVPLSSRFVCGLHVETNLAVVPASYNLAKGSKYWPNGYGEHAIENLQYNRMS